MTARVERQCDECVFLERYARARGGTHRCRTCGAEIEGDGRRVRHQPRRVRAPTQRPDDVTRRVRLYVSEVLAYGAAVDRVERRAVGSRSSTGAAIDTLRLGFVGSGNSGTKRPAPPPEDGELLHVDPVLAARYRSLRGDALLATNAVMADGQGDQTAPMTVGHRGPKTEPRVVEATLAQRIAFRCAPAQKIERWAAKILRKESDLALDDAQLVGTQLLEQGAEAWWKK